MPTKKLRKAGDRSSRPEQRHARIAQAASIAALTLSLTACGGNVGNDTGTAPVAAQNSFASVAMAGELLTYSIDTSKLAYSYTIADSQYDLAGKTRSGTLTRNGDGTYSPAGIEGARIAVLDNGLLLGAIHETVNGAPATIPVLGISDPVSERTALAADYNFIQRSCVADQCRSLFGTLTIAADGTWKICDGDMLAGACQFNASIGTLSALGNGKWRLASGAAIVGTAIAAKSNSGQNVIIVDLTDKQLQGWGVGMLVAATRQPMEPGSMDGTWLAATAAGQWGTFTVAGRQVTCAMLDGSPCDNSSFIPNLPWQGVMADSSGSGFGLATRGGLYMGQDTDGYAEIAVRIR